MNTNCALCSNADPKTFRAKIALNYGSQYDLVECPGCGVLYLNPLPSAGELRAFYSPSYSFYGPDWERQQGRGRVFARHVLSSLQPGRFLDVGCAAGFFLDGIRNSSAWQVYGVDFGESAVRFARERLQLNVSPGSLADVAFPDAFFDFIHMSNVLEHVPDPAGLLRQCRRILKPGGVFYLSVPNGVIDARDLIEYYRSENEPAQTGAGHLFFFPKRTLIWMLNDCGFSIQATRTYGIKRGLKRLGYLPRRPGWKRDYAPRRRPENDASAEISVPASRRRPYIYHLFRFLHQNLKMVRGLHEVGVDFWVILKRKG